MTRFHTGNLGYRIHRLSLFKNIALSLVKPDNIVSCSEDLQTKEGLTHLINHLKRGKIPTETFVMLREVVIPLGRSGWDSEFGMVIPLQNVTWNVWIDRTPAPGQGFLNPDPSSPCVPTFTTKSSTHRVFLNCPTCGKLLPFSRLWQHIGTKTCLALQATT